MLIWCDPHLALERKFYIMNKVQTAAMYYIVYRISADVSIHTHKHTLYILYTHTPHIYMVLGTSRKLPDNVESSWKSLLCGAG